MGSIDITRELSPSEKHEDIRLVQWSGNTSPFEEALSVTRKAGLFNINGGDSRYDSEYPSYASVSPIGLKVGDERQIYSSNSNENTYTNLWTDRFFGFVYLQTTVRNTEQPMRVQPFNIYYHMYSGEKQASLAALHSNLEYARKQELIPIFASDFAEIAEGFYAMRLVRAGENRWRIVNRGKLNTLRVDNAVLKTVDFQGSEGVIGQRYYQGNLYVSLDPEVAEPLISLVAKDTSKIYADAQHPYVIHSSWLIKGLIFVKKRLMFAAHGHGEGEFTLKVPMAGTFDVIITRNEEELSRYTVKSDEEGVLHFILKDYAGKMVDVAITQHGNSE